MLPVVPMVLAACAGSTMNSGVGDRYFEEPPFYAGQRVSPELRLVHVPVQYQRGAVQEPQFDPSAAAAATPLGALLAQMNAYLDSLVATDPVAAWPSGTRAPDVMFGCATEGGMECVPSDESARASEPFMVLAVARPDAEWTAWAAAALEDAGADALLLIMLETSEYWPRQRDLLGRKEVQLGTSYAQRVPWLTSLDDPIQVLQLTGALIGRDGKALRIGAEGIYARPSNLGLSALGAQELITDEDVERVRSMRRDDLSGSPLAWQVALRTLVSGLREAGH